MLYERVYACLLNNVSWIFVYSFYWNKSGTNQSFCFDTQVTSRIMTVNNGAFTWITQIYLFKRPSQYDWFTSTGALTFSQKLTGKWPSETETSQCVKMVCRLEEIESGETSTWPLGRHLFTIFISRSIDIVLMINQSEIANLLGYRYYNDTIKKSFHANFRKKNILT